MSYRATLLIVIASACTLVEPGKGQERPQRADSLENEVRVLKARLDSLERVVQRLMREGRDPEPVLDELAALRAAAQTAAGETQADTTEQQSRTRNLSALNPEISVTGDVVGNYTAPADGSNNFSATPREFEFSFQSALDPYTRTKIYVTREEDFEIAGFPEGEEEEEAGHGFEIEEGYMYWVGLPGGFGAKLGKFRQEIGLYNRWHTHALFEVERPLAATTFLGEDGLIQTGAAVSFPALSFGPTTQTATLEVTRANNEALFAGGNQLGYLGRLQSFIDLGNSYLQLGATGVYGKNDDESLTSRVLALDFAFRWAPPGRAQLRSFQLKSEWYFAEQDTGAEEASGSGGYLQASYRLSRQLILGTRADYANAYGDDGAMWQFVPSISWWQSEWVRLRLQYNYLTMDGGGGNHTILFQSVWAIGPHKHEAY